MLFGNRNKHISQIKAVMEEITTELLRGQTQELTRVWEDQSRSLDQAMEKNHRALRNLSDTMEDFLDNQQEEDAGSRQMRQELSDAGEREQKLLGLVELYRQQTELFAQWLAGWETGTGANAKEAWRQQYSMLKGKIEAESSLCGIENTGVQGEPVDYRLHEVLRAVEPETEGQEGTVAEVYSQGMLYRGAVVKKARVLAYMKA